MHPLELEKEAWVGIPKSNQIYKKRKDEDDVEDEEHTLLKCLAYEHICDNFSSLLQKPKDIWSLLNESPQKSLGTFITKVLSHREHLLSLS